MNGDDTFPWAKKPAVPDNRKRAVSKKTIEKLISSKFCQKCALQGIASPVTLFQINDEEALLMCKNVDCTFIPSSWESLIVKRSINKQSFFSRKKSSSSLSSQISSKSGRNTLNVLKGTSKSVSLLRYSACSLSSSSPWLQAIPLPDTAAASSSQVQRYLVTPNAAHDSSLEGKERKTLVPIAPFLNGHAHSFSSFQTNKLEHKFQRRTLVQHQLIPPSTPLSNDKNYTITYSSNKKSLSGSCSGSVLGSKRRTCSLDSDSLSGGSSSLDSRPTTPVSETAPSGKKVKRIVLPPETISKLLNGSMKLEIRKSDKTGADVVLRSVKKDITDTNFKNSDYESPASGFEVNRHNFTNSQLELNVANITHVANGSNNIEITELGSLQDIVNSGESGVSLTSLSDRGNSTADHIDAINFQLQADSIKSHIEAINQHIYAINRSVGRGDICIPLDFSQLCQKFGAEPTTSKSCKKSEWLNNTDLSSESDITGTDSLQSNCISFIPVGIIETQTPVSTDIPWEGNTLMNTSLVPEGLDEPFDSFCTSLQISDTQLKNSFDDILNQ